jgi:hypothetical protein
MMGERSSDAVQTATGIGIAQATNGGTANVSIGFSPEDVNRMLSAALSQMASAMPLGTSVVLDAPLLHTETPLRPEPVLRRDNLEDRVMKCLSSGKGVVLRGDFGSGRTELARGVSEGYDKAFWLDLQANAHLSPHMALDLFARKINAEKIGRSSRSKPKNRKPKKTLIVIDNVEIAVLQPEFDARLQKLAAERSLSIIVISLHRLPNPLSSLFHCVDVDRFSEKEVISLVRLYKAPKEVLTIGLMNLVSGVTHGMPYLVALLLNYWVSKGWATDDDAWLKLLNSDFAADVRSETQRKLLGLLEPSSSELLYRLSLLMNPFNEMEVFKIAAIEPPIDRAQERLHSLSGVWLQRVNDRQWRTSPLLKGSGKGNLLKKTQDAVHSAAADIIFAKKILNQTDTSAVILHLLLAERYNEAATVYIRALHALSEADVDVYPGSLLSLWKNLSIPPQIDLGLRILIRGLQVANDIRRNEEYLPAVEDLKQLIEQAKEIRDQVSVYGAAALVAMKLLEKEPVTALPFISIAIQGERFIPKEAQGFLNDHQATEIFWIAAMKADSLYNVQKWMNEVDKLPEDARTAMMEAEFAADSASRMFDSLWWREQDEPGSERNWALILKSLKEFESLAERWKTPLVCACILRSQLSIRIVHLREIEAPCQEAERFYTENHGQALAVFILANGIATWLIDADRWDLAATWLTRAYQYTGPKLPLHQQLNCLRYGQLLLREGAPSIVPFERALAIGEESDTLTIFNQLKAKAELATFLWKTGKVHELFSTWSEVVRGVLEHREDDKYWKHFFIGAANNTTFFSDPTQFKPGEGYLTEPFPGMFIGGMQSLADRYHPRIVFLVPGVMAQWADKLGRIHEAAEWAALTEQIGRNVSKQDAAKMYQMHAIPLDIKEGRFPDALNHAIETSKGFQCDLDVEIPKPRQAELAARGLSQTINRRTQFGRSVPLTLAVFPSLLEIAVDAARNPETARESLERLLGQIRSNRKDDPEVWDAGIAALEEILQGELRWTDVSGVAPAEDDYIGHMGLLLRSFGLWFTQNDVPQDLFLAQANRASFLAAYFPQMGWIGTIICISIAKMWAGKINRDSFYFRLPRQTAARVSELAEDAHLGEMFEVLADSIGVGMSNQTRATFKTYVLRRKNHD